MTRAKGSFFCVVLLFRIPRSRGFGSRKSLRLLIVFWQRIVRIVVRAAMSARAMPKATRMSAKVPTGSKYDLEKAAVELEAVELGVARLGGLRNFKRWSSERWSPKQ